MSIKAIETKYNGYRFRSRLEARWAVFFDTLNIPYEYEKEGFDLDGTWYLPDFWLPEHKRWIEIKGQPPTLEEINKADKLHDGTGYPVIIFHGLPGDNDGYAQFCDVCDSGGGYGAIFAAHWIYCWDCRKFDIDLRQREDRSIVTPEWENIDYCTCKAMDYSTDFIPLLEAYTAARQARFEHGR